MTVQELIRELQAMPNQGVRVEIVLSSCYSETEMGMMYATLDDSDSLEADEVCNLGPFVLIRSK